MRDLSQLTMLRVTQRDRLLLKATAQRTGKQMQAILADLIRGGAERAGIAAEVFDTALEWGAELEAWAQKMGRGNR